MQPPFYRWDFRAPKTITGSLSYLPLQELFDISFAIQNPDGKVSNKASDLHKKKNAEI